MSKSNFVPKVYRALGQVHLSIPHKEEVNGETKYRGQISFEGGQINPKRVMSTYKATDPKIAEYLDNHSALKGNPGRNTLFECLGEEEKADVKTEPKKVEDTETDKDIELEQVEGPEKVQEASDYLYNEYEDVKRSDVKTNAGVQDVAKEKGIEFPNL